MRNFLRAEHGWSRTILARGLDVSRQAVDALETGRYDSSLPLALGIARFFGKPIESILGEEAGA